MSRVELLVDGRVLDDRHPGVRDFWIPILRAWAAAGGRGLVAHRRDVAPAAALIAAGFSPVDLRHGARDPFGQRDTRRVVALTGAAATLSPLYLTLDGAPRHLGTIFDLAGRTHARSFSSRLLWEVAVRRMLRRASTVVCPTAATAAELERRWPGVGGRVGIVSAVAPSPPRPDADQLARYGITAPYALVVASHRPHKRLALLARAWSAAASSVPLVLVGAATEELNAPPAVRGLGFVSADTVEALLATAMCLLSASVVEGFGLPVLAALRAGLPVVATRQAALEEVAGDAVFWCDADDLPGLVRAAAALAASPSGAAERAARGRERASRFTASSAAQQLAHLLG